MRYIIKMGNILKGFRITKAIFITLDFYGGGSYE